MNELLSLALVGSGVVPSHSGPSSVRVFFSPQPLRRTGKPILGLKNALKIRQLNAHPIFYV